MREVSQEVAPLPPPPPPPLPLPPLPAEHHDSPLIDGSAAGSGDDGAAHSLSSLEPDTFALVCAHLRHRDVAAVAASCGALRHAVASNDRLWSGLYSRQFPQPWQRLTAQQQRQPRSSVAGSSSSTGGGGGGVAPGGWREAFLQTHAACQQLVSTEPACREWTTDTTPVHLAAVYGSGPKRLTLVAQGSSVELRLAPSAAPSAASKSFQFYGHSARVSCAAVLRPAGGAAVQRVGLVTGSHDQTVRLWAANADPESYEFRNLDLFTPQRTLRGHQEAVTSLRLVTSTAGVTIAATGGKDRVVRLWGLAPLLPSPVHKPQIATLRGHGAPVTCLASCSSSSSSAASWEWDSEPGWDGSCGSSGNGSSSSGGGSTSSGAGWLFSGSLDARVKGWDPWTAGCTGTAKLAGPVSGMAGAAAAPQLQPHTLLVSTPGAVQLLDARSMRSVHSVALAAPAELHCFAQWGWDLAVGASDGARLFDLRALSSSCSSSAAGGSPGGSGSAGGGVQERLRVSMGRRQPVTSIHLDRHKLVTATDTYGEASVRVWCARSGDCLAELGTSLPQQRREEEEKDGGEAAETAQTEGGGGQVAAEEQAAWEEWEEGGEEERPLAEHAHQRQYRREWEGATALACRGALLVSGSSGGTVFERDWSRGGMPGNDGGGGGEGSRLAGKFWQYA